MQIACEGHPGIVGVSPGARFVQHPPEILSEPVVVGDTFVDGFGCSIYGSVLHDGDRFRMWYQAWPRDFDGTDSLAVAYAESDDGLTWRKPSLGLMERDGTSDNHLTNLPFHAPSVFVDPHAPSADQRYRAFGYTVPERAVGYDLTSSDKGYYSAWSADGLRWTVEDAPLWPHADVITAAWDSGRDTARIAYKHNGLTLGQLRRRFYTCQWRNRVSTPPALSFVPDELDDLAARAHGAVTADVYGLSWIFSAGPTVAVAWMFRHHAPLGHSPDRLWHYGNHGPVDLQLRYQLEPGGRWLAQPGRPDWVTASDMPAWASGGLYAASHAIDVGDETWLYFTGTQEQHGWSGAGVDGTRQRQDLMDSGGFTRIGRMKWPRQRLLGITADRPEWIDLLATPTPSARGLCLNLTTRPGGRVRVALLGDDRKPLQGFDFEDCDALPEDAVEAAVSWQGVRLPSAWNGAPVLARVEIDRASLWAFS